MDRLISAVARMTLKDWVLLYLAASLSVILVMVEIQNMRSIRDRAALNDRQAAQDRHQRELERELKNARDTLRVLDGRSDYLDRVVKRLDEADRKRREAREKEAARKGQGQR